MLRAGMMINAMQSALENSEDALDTVRGDVIAACFVVDRFMLEKHGAEAIVCARFVRVGDLSNDRSLECAFIGAGYRAWLHPSAALAFPRQPFCRLPAPSVTPLGRVFVFFKTANIRFVN